MRKIWVESNFSGTNVEDWFDQAQRLDDAGVDAMTFGEVTGSDPFVMMAVMAMKTSRIRIGTAIINYWSRSPMTMIMGFNSLDVLSGGRTFVGLGSSAPLTIEGWHGIPYRKAVTRLGEYIDIMNLLMRGERLVYDGTIFKHTQGMRLGAARVREHIPIWVASLAPASIRLTAQKADGWLPRHIPRQGWKEHVQDMHAQLREFGRDPSEMEIRAPGFVYVTDDPDGTYENLRRSTAHFMTRMGPFHHEQFVRWGMGDEAKAVDAARRESGFDAAQGLVSLETTKSLHYAGDVGGAIDWMEEQLEAGYHTHNVVVTEQDPAKQAQIYRQLVG